jgi:hypothetical protein
MRAGARILCILVLVYNLYLAFGGLLIFVLRGVGVGGNWLLAYPTVRTLVLLIAVGLFMFLLAHSIRLIMFYESSRRIQFWLSAVYPLFRIPYGLLVLFSLSLSVPLFLMVMVVATAMDVGIALAMRSAALSRLFSEAEERRTAKYWAKKNGLTL